MDACIFFSCLDLFQRLIRSSRGPWSRRVPHPFNESLQALGQTNCCRQRLGVGRRQLHRQRLGAGNVMQFATKHRDTTTATNTTAKPPQSNQQENLNKRTLVCATKYSCTLPPTHPCIHPCMHASLPSIPSHPCY